MKKIKLLLLVCLMLVSSLSVNAFAALPETVQPLWDNTMAVTLMHDNVGTTAHCYVDIAIGTGATIRNAKVWLIAMDENPQAIVHTWENPTFTVGNNNMHSFYETVPNIVEGNTYQLVFQCEVWRNGTCDYISQALNAIY